MAQRRINAVGCGATARCLRALVSALDHRFEGEGLDRLIDKRLGEVSKPPGAGVRSVVASGAVQRALRWTQREEFSQILP